MRVCIVDRDGEFVFYSKFGEKPLEVSEQGERNDATYGFKDHCYHVE